MTHIERVHEWAQARGLYDTSDPSVQFGKAVGELGELIIALANEDIEGIKDGIGDVRVCLINLCKIAEVHFTEALASPRYPINIGWLMREMSRIYDNFQNYDEMSAAVAYVNQNLLSIAIEHDLTLEECDNHAWDQIKDRTGKTINGEFIKDA